MQGIIMTLLDISMQETWHLKHVKYKGQEDKKMCGTWSTTASKARGTWDMSARIKQETLDKREHVRQEVLETQEHIGHNAQEHPRHEAREGWQYLG